MTSISGGLVWHWRAFQRRAQWEATCRQIAGFHRRHGPCSGTLVLLGCSAGWMLESAWLKGFHRIVAVDLDPWAPHLFALRHPQVARPLWIRANALARLDQLLGDYPDAFLLFDNMLGQQGLIAVEQGRSEAGSMQRIEHELGELGRRLAGRCWGSLHDCISGPVRRPQPMPGCRSERAFPAKPLLPITSALPALTAASTATVSSLSERCAAAAIETCHRVEHPRLLSRIAESGEVEPHGEWLDHLSAAIFPPALARQYLLWPFSATYWHWLEIGWVAAKAR